MELKKGHSYGIDLLRCLLMLSIVACHTDGHGLWANTNAWWRLIFTVVLYWHVDAFVAISGWYGVRFSLLKYFRLWGIVFFYSLSSYAYSLWTGVGSGFYVRAGWYGASYFVLLFASPFVNTAIEACIEKSKRFAWYAWGLCIVAFVLTWLPHHLYTGVYDTGYTPLGFTTLLFVYVTVRIIQLTGLGKYVSTKKFGSFAWGLLIVCMCVFGAGVFYKASMRGDPFSYIGLCRWFSFGAPSQWLIAISIVAFFSTIKVSPIVARVSSFLSPSMFGIFIMHECTVYGKMLYVPLQGWLQHRGWSPLAIVAFTAITTFAICLIVDLLRRLLVYVARPVLVCLEDRISAVDARFINMYCLRSSCR